MLHKTEVWSCKVCVPYNLTLLLPPASNPVGCDVKHIDGCNGKISNIQKGIESKDELPLVQETPGATEGS